MAAGNEISTGLPPSEHLLGSEGMQISKMLGSSLISDLRLRVLDRIQALLQTQLLITGPG
jgi:hypothetical protein